LLWSAPHCARGVWPPVAVGDDDLARGVALNDWGDRPPTAATSHSPAAPTVRRIAPKGCVRRRNVPLIAFPVITTTATTGARTTPKTCRRRPSPVAGMSGDRSTHVVVSAPRRRQPAAQKSWGAFLASYWSVLPSGECPVDANPPCGETHLAEANRSAKSNPAKSAGSATVHHDRTPVRCHPQTMFDVHAVNTCVGARAA
jgi:hypothetical protein